MRLALLGPHQGRNAALAAQAAVLVEPDITDDALIEGLTEAQWPGRLEVVAAPGAGRLFCSMAPRTPTPPRARGGPSPSSKSGFPDPFTSFLAS